MEFIKGEEIMELMNPGIVSRQLLNGENSTGRRVTITEVHLEVGACQPRHTHDSSEQIWYAIKEEGKLLLSDDEEKQFKAEDVRGLLNEGETEFIYISVTAPSIDFGYAYQKTKRQL